MRCAPPHTKLPKRNRPDGCGPVFLPANNGSDVLTGHPEPCRPLPICLVRVGGLGGVIPATSRNCHITCVVCGVMSARWLFYVTDSFGDKQGIWLGAPNQTHPT
jgi:hypothetical protein